MAFRAGDLQVLVATTVIEVGVDDAPNATVMVILDADRFGIAQLHPLRGRVGRGAPARAASSSAPAPPPTPRTPRRHGRTTDGFGLAEVDLDLRGEAPIMGARQKGRNDLRLASLRCDREWVGKARGSRFSLVDADPTSPGTPTCSTGRAASVPGHREPAQILRVIPPRTSSASTAGARATCCRTSPEDEGSSPATWSRTAAPTATTGGTSCSPTPTTTTPTDRPLDGGPGPGSGCSDGS